MGNTATSLGRGEGLAGATSRDDEVMQDPKIAGDAALAPCAFDAGTLSAQALGVVGLSHLGAVHTVRRSPRTEGAIASREGGVEPNERYKLVGFLSWGLDTT